MSPRLLNILLILLPIVLYYGYINPAYTGEPGLIWTPEISIQDLQLQNVQYQDTINQVSFIDQQVKSTNSDYQKIDPDLKKKVETMLPDTIDPIKLRNEIITIAANSNIALTNLSVDKDTKGGNFYLVTFDLKARYPAFKKFMENYEKNQRLFILESANISRQEKNLDDPTVVIDDSEALNVHMQSRVYYYLKQK